MKHCFYNQQGKLVCYCEDKKTVYTYEGKPVAYIDGGDIYTFSGSHLGYLEDGNVWDHNGDMFLFTDISRFGVGPLKPKKALKPLKKLKSRIPLKGKKLRKPSKPLKSKKWSSSSPIDVFIAI